MPVELVALDVPSDLAGPSVSPEKLNTLPLGMFSRALLLLGTAGPLGTLNEKSMSPLNVKAPSNKFVLRLGAKDPWVGIGSQVKGAETVVNDCFFGMRAVERPFPSDLFVMTKAVISVGFKDEVYSHGCSCRPRTYCVAVARE